MGRFSQRLLSATGCGAAAARVLGAQGVVPPRGRCRGS